MLLSPEDLIARLCTAVPPIEGPGQLEPRDPCKLSKLYIGNMRTSAPALVHELDPILRARYCGR